MAREAVSFLEGSKPAAAAVPSMLLVPVVGLRLPPSPVPLNPGLIPGLNVPPVVVPVPVLVPAALALEGKVHPEKLGSVEDREAAPVKSQVAPEDLYFWK